MASYILEELLKQYEEALREQGRRRSLLPDVFANVQAQVNAYGQYLQDLGRLSVPWRSLAEGRPEVAAALASADRWLREGPLGQFMGSFLRSFFGEPGQRHAESLGISVPQEGTLPDIAGRIASSVIDVGLASTGAGALTQAAARIPGVAGALSRLPWLQSLAQGLGTGAGVSALRAARGEEITPRELAENVAFWGGMGAASPFISQFLIRNLPTQVLRYGYGPIREVAEGVVGSLAAAPFTSASSFGDWLRDLGYDMAADAILGTLGWAINREEREMIQSVSAKIRAAADAERQARREALARFGLSEEQIRDTEAAMEAVKQSFRQQMRAAHPDLGGDPQTFQELVRARDMALEIIEGQRQNLPQRVYERAREYLRGLFRTEESMPRAELPRIDQQAPQPEPPRIALPAPQPEPQRMEQVTLGAESSTEPPRVERPTPRPAAETPAPAAPEPAPTAAQQAEPGVTGRFRPEDIDFNLARRAFQGTSFVPEDHARAVQEDYVRHMEDLYRKLEPLAKTPEQRAILEEEIERYRQNYIGRLHEWLRVHAQLISPMISGPARFPVERQRRLNERERRVVEEFLEWQKRAQDAIRRRLLEARTPDQVVDDEFERLKREIDRVAVVLREIDEENAPWDRQAFVNSLAGRIRRSADSGNIEAVQRALDYIRQVQANMRKPIFTERNSIWTVVDQAKARQQAAASRPGTETIAEFQGVRIVRNNELDRVQIFFDSQPQQNVRQELRAAGWRWSPSNQAWQRKLTYNAERSAKEIIGRHFQPVAESSMNVDKTTPPAPRSEAEPMLRSEPEPEPEPMPVRTPVEAEAPVSSASDVAEEEPAITQRDRELFNMGYRHEHARMAPEDLNLLNEPAYQLGQQRAREEQREMREHFAQLQTAFREMHGMEPEQLRRAILDEFQGKGSLPERVHKVQGVTQAKRIADQTGRAVLYVNVNDDQGVPIHGRLGHKGPLYAIELPWRFDTTEREIKITWNSKYGPLRVYIGNAFHGMDAHDKPDYPSIIMPRRWSEDTVPYPKVPIVGPNTDEYLPSHLKERLASQAGEAVGTRRQEPQPQQTSAHTPAPAPAEVTRPRLEATGATATVYTERNTPVNVRYAVVEPDELIVSNDPVTLRVNPAFPQELQPRDRTRAASEAQIERIAANLQPAFLGESPKASEGAPIVGPDGVVESGNARTIALIRAYESGRADHYKQWLIENAERFGLDPQAIRSMERPILVRVRESDVDRVRFAQEANEGSVAAMSATEQAVVDAARISDGLMNLFKPSADGEILTAENRQFISRFMEEVVGPADSGRYMTADGALSQEGLNRIRNAIFQRAYGDASALAMLAESLDNNVRNITAGMVAAAPYFADLRDKIARGMRHDLDPSADITAAMRKMSSLRSSGQSVETYLRQSLMFAEEDLSPLAKDFLAVFDRYKRSSKKIGAILRTYAEMVEALGDPRQASLLDDVPLPTKAEILQAAVKKVESGYEPGSRQVSLFESEALGSGVAEGTSRQVASTAELAEQAAQAVNEELRQQREGIGAIAPPLRRLLAESQRKAQQQERSPYAMQNPEAELRYQRAHGLPRVSKIEQVRAWLTQLANRATREFEHLPHTMEYAELRNALLNLRKAPLYASNTAITYLRNITHKLDPDSYDLFERKVIYENLLENVERFDLADDQLMQFGLTPAELRQELARINEAVEGNPFVKEALETRRSVMESVTKEYVRHMEDLGFHVEKRLTRQHYYRQQVLQYALAESWIKGTGRRLRTPRGRGFTKERTATQADFNTNYIEAEYEVLTQMLFDIEVAKVLKLVRDQFDISRELKREAKQMNQQALRELAEQNPEIADRLDEFRQRIGMGFSRLMNMAANGKLPYGDFQDVHDAWVETYHFRRDNDEDLGPSVYNVLLDEEQVNRDYQYVSWLYNNGPDEAQIAAGIILKATSERRQFIKDVLGDRYMTFEKLAEHKEGYTLWQPDPGNVFYLASTLPERVAMGLLEGLLEEAKIDKDDIRRVLAMGGKRPQWVIPEEVAATLNHLYERQERGTIRSLLSALRRVWSWSVLFSPLRLPKYIFRNITGDAEAAWIGNSSTFRKVPQAIEELRGVIFQGKEPTGPLREWLRRGGLESLASVNELADVTMLRVFDNLRRLSRDTRNPFQRVWSWYLQETGKIRDFTESVLRYAAFLDYLEQIEKNGGLPKNFGASIPDEIIGLSNKYDKAFRLANDLIGPYDQTTVLGREIAEFIPFWRFQEINMRRYWRFMKNAAADPQLAREVGRRAMIAAGVRGTAALAYRVGRLVLRIAALSALLATYNNLFWPEEEASLPEYVRSKPHIILGRSKDGTVRYFSSVGILGDALEWFGAGDPFRDLFDYFQGRRDLKQIIKDMALTPADWIAGAGKKIVGSINPLGRLLYEIPAKTKVYPEPTTIRDPFQHIADTFGLGDVYKLVTKKPGRRGSDLIENVFWYKQDMDEGSYWFIKDLVAEYLKETGKSAGGRMVYDDPDSEAGRRSTALYYFRQAVRYGDKELAQKYLDEYGRAGGTKEGLQRSIESLHPLYGIAEKDRAAFLATLNEFEYGQYEAAMRHYAKLMEGIARVDTSTLRSNSTRTTGGSVTLPPSTFTFSWSDKLPR